MRFLLSLAFLLIFTIFFNSEVKSELSIDTDIKILRAQSEEGNPDAKFYLGSLYYIGRDLKQDYLIKTLKTLLVWQLDLIKTPKYTILYLNWDLVLLRLEQSHHLSNMGIQNLGFLDWLKMRL